VLNLTDVFLFQFQIPVRKSLFFSEEEEMVSPIVSDKEKQRKYSSS